MAAAVLPLLIAFPALGVAPSTDGNRRVQMTENFRPVAPMGGVPQAIPAAVSRFALTDAEAATPMHVETVLKLRHFAELERRVAAGEIISREEMAARYLPTESDYQAVARWLTSQGLTVAKPGASHAVVSADGTPRQWEQTFQTKFARVTFKGTEYTAAVAAPSVPADIEARVSSIHGLQPYLRPQKSGAIKKSAISSEAAPPYTVGDILTAYNVSASGLTGAGQQIGIVIDTVPSDSDLTKFWSANGVAQSTDNIITVNVEGGKLPAASGEETLDVSWSSGIASSAQIIIYACGDLDNVNDGYSRILDDLQDGSRPDLHQVSMSYGSGEVTDETDADMKSVHELFTAIAAYGVSLFASSGDEGAYGNGGRTVQVLYPASDPNVTGVGGTSLILNSYTTAISSEIGWSPSSTATHGPGGGGGGSDAEDSSGGGISVYFARPAWQTGSTVPSGTMRLVPDVAFAADPDYGCYLVFNGEVDQYGGTSWGSPSWAALCALVNQSRAAAGLAPLGVANVSLYAQLGTSGFRDIISGNDGVYYAGVGYDLVTGLGTPDFGALLPSLLGTTASTTPAAPSITSTLTGSGTVGTAFSYQITASNSPTAFAASGLPSGLTVDASSGLISGTPTAAGTFTVTLSATNSGGSGTGTLNLAVAAAPLPTVTLVATVADAVVSQARTGEATLSIPTALSTDLTVYYTLKGSATNGSDYAYLKGYAKIKAGRTSKGITVSPLGNLDGASKKTVKITLTQGDDYVVGTTGAVKITILED